MKTTHVQPLESGDGWGEWAIGSDLLLKECSNEGELMKGQENEVAAVNLLTSSPYIFPVPKILRQWVDDNGRCFLLQEKIKGQKLEDAWPSLSKAQKENIADGVVGVRKQLRMLNSTSIQGIGQPQSLLRQILPVRDKHAPFHSDDELWNAISLNLERPTTKVFPQKALDNLRKCLPKCEPYVVTHCDLNMAKITVQNGKLAGITDWDWASHHPIWYEYVSASSWVIEKWGTEEDKEWASLLQERMRFHGEGFEDAADFVQDLRSLSRWPDLDERGQEVMERLCSN